MGGADLKGLSPALHTGEEGFDSQLSGPSSVTEVSSAGIGTLLPPTQPCLVSLVITLHPHCWITHRCNLPGLLHTISKALRLPVWAGNWYAALMHPGLQPAFCFGGHALSLLVERNWDPVICPANSAVEAALA